MDNTSTMECQCFHLVFGKAYTDVTHFETNGFPFCAMQKAFNNLMG